MSLFTPARRPGPANRRSPIHERFMAKIEIEGSCWAFTGYVSPNGYGQMSDGTRIVYVHRWAYEHFIGPIPEGHHIDHLCRNRRCCKPTHLEPVTQAENNRRAWTARSANREAAAA